jgi:diacylglycerol kinase family enzyme
MQIILVHNTGAGDGDYDEDALLALMREHGHQVQFFETTDDWRPAAQFPVELVVAAGGDGTVEDVARHLAGSGIPIGVLPLGTANNVASALGIAVTPIPELVASWAHAQRRPFDTGRAITRGETLRFVESVGVGLLAEAIAEITQGGAGYVDRLAAAEERMEAAIVVLQQTLRRLEPAHIELVIDGQHISGDYLLVEIMNFGCAGPNLRLAPDAAEADGLFDIVLADAGHRTQLFEDLPIYQQGKRPSLPLSNFRGRHVILSSHRHQLLHVDDELRGDEGPVELTVEPRALTFLV